MTDNPFEVLSNLLTSATEHSARYMDARSAYVEHGIQEHLQIMLEQATSLVGAAILASRVAHIIEFAYTAPGVDSEGVALAMQGARATRERRIATGHVLLDVQRFIPLPNLSMECHAMISEMQAHEKGAL